MLIGIRPAMKRARADIPEPGSGSRPAIRSVGSTTMTHAQIDRRSAAGAKAGSQGAAPANDYVQCYAYGPGERWHGICVDLDIAVDGASFQEVRRSLATSIEMYVETVAGLPAEEQRCLLTRRAPWHVRTSLAISESIRRLIRGAGNNHARSFFLPLHT